MNLKDKVFVVTGGGNGIGREVVLNLLRRGSKVAAIDISRDALLETKELANSKSNELRLYDLDITNLDKVEEAHKSIIKDFNYIDGLIHVAGIIQPFVKVMDLSYEDIERVMNVNFYGTVYLNKTFLTSLLQREQSYLVNVSSMGGFLPVPGQAVYGASKAAVKLMTEALYSELKDTNVSVTLVFPGAINTNISANSNVNMDVEEERSNTKVKMLDADIAAEKIVKAMLKKKLYSYVGSDSKMMNRLYRLAPKKSTNLISKKMGNLLK